MNHAGGWRTVLTKAAVWLILATVALGLWALVLWVFARTVGC